MTVARTGSAIALIGRRGADHLTGGYGNERLVGGTGNDVLRGRQGRDLAEGGTGRDRCAAEVRRSLRALTRPPLGLESPGDSRPSGRPVARQARWTAPVRSAARATAASRAAAASPSLRVRSGARKRRA